MDNSRFLGTVLRLAVGTLLLAVLLHTFVISGLVTPVQVAGSSMAPTLRGAHVVVTCAECGERLEVGAEFAATSPRVDCTHCGRSSTLPTGLVFRSADRLVIDRTAFARREPRRGEVVVAHSPEDGSQLCVKRVVGLPGETIEIYQGDVWIDGRPWAKPLELQRALRQRVALTGEMITDDFAYNAGLSRVLLPVRDFMVSSELRAPRSGVLLLELRDGWEEVQTAIDVSTGKVSVRANGQLLASAQLSERSQRRLAGGIVLLELSSFDRQLLLAIDSRGELKCPLDAAVPPPVGIERPFHSGGGVQTWDLKLYRDIYYTRQAVNRPLGPERVTLGPDEYYLLGDNSAISIDSRSWGGVPRRLLVGRVLGVR